MPFIHIPLLSPLCTSYIIIYRGWIRVNLWNQKMVILDPKKWSAWSFSASKQHCCSSPRYFKRPRAKAPLVDPTRWFFDGQSDKWCWKKTPAELGFIVNMLIHHIISDWYIIYLIHIYSYWIRGSKTNEHHWGAPPCPGGNFQATTAFWDRETMWCDRLTNISVYSFNVYIYIYISVYS